MLTQDVPHPNASAEAAVARRSVLLGHVGRTRLWAAHAVFVAAAALVVVVLLAMQREGNGDLGRAAVIGTAFWTVGWAVQLLAVFSFAAVAGLRIRWLSIGLLGVELLPHRWSAERTGGIALSGIGSLLLAGVAMNMFSSVPGRAAVPVLWNPPSLGLAVSDSLWRAGAWLLWFQAAAQLIPLPRTLGRTVLVAVVSALGAGSPPATRLAAARRCVAAAALAVAVLGVALVPVGAADWEQAAWRLPVWLLTLVLAVALWMSSRRIDLAESLQRLTAGGRADPSTDQSETFWQAHQRRIQERRRWRRVAEALERERGEAVDAAKLDAILQQLHHGGPGSISPSDRAVLERVSKTLREHRQRQHGGESR